MTAPPWQRLFICDRCGMQYRAEHDGAASRKCICGAELRRDTGDLIREWLAGDESLEDLKPRIDALLRQSPA